MINRSQRVPMPLVMSTCSEGNQENQGNTPPISTVAIGRQVRQAPVGLVHEEGIDHAGRDMIVIWAGNIDMLSPSATQKSRRVFDLEKQP